MPTDHHLTHSGGTFKISPYLQDVACFLGQEAVFDRAEELMEKLLGIQFCDKQIERVCHHYGELIQIQTDEEIRSGQSPQIKIPDEVHYAMIDGGMVLTREEKWKEMKVARIFPQSARTQLSEKRNWLRESIYVAHLGDHKTFLPKVEHILDAIKVLVFVADGAPWIWIWIEANYPESIQILDFFHAKEHLCQFAEEYFKLPEQRKQWIKDQTDLFFEDGIETVIENIASLSEIPNEKTLVLKKNLLNYYRQNQKRMLYKTFQDNGLMIGSGPIESAHRHLIQQRLKLSGQRWTKKGVQQIANLRVCEKSGHWGKIRYLISGVAA